MFLKNDIIKLLRYAIIHVCMLNKNTILLKNKSASKYNQKRFDDLHFSKTIAIIIAV